MEPGHPNRCLSVNQQDKIDQKKEQSDVYPVLFCVLKTVRECAFQAHSLCSADPFIRTFDPLSTETALRLSPANRIP